MLLSHPHKSLEKHLFNTSLVGEKIFSQKKLYFKTYSSEQLKALNRLNLMVHDLGKAIRFFQEYMEDIQNKCSEIRHRDSEEKAHGLISGIFAFAAAKALLQDERLAFISFIVVGRHHDSLDNLQQYFAGLGALKKQELLLKQFDSIDRNEVQKLIDGLGLGFDIQNMGREQFKGLLKYMCSGRFEDRVCELLQSAEIFLLINFLFSILIFSDKLEAIFCKEKVELELYLKQLDQRPEIDSLLVEQYKLEYVSKGKAISTLREAIYRDVIESVEKLGLEDRILSLNLPTGAGKTLAVLKAALVLRSRIQREKGYKPRLVYVLPFTSVIEQNYEVFEKVLKTQEQTLLLKHHHLSERKYRYNENAEYKGAIPEHLVETWESEVVVSTFVQFLHSVLTNKNRQLKKFHNIANSIIILDEVQNIPHKYWPLIRKVFMTMSECMGCYFILMTATMPLIFSENKNEIRELANNKEKYFEAFDRIEIDASRIKRQMSLDEFKTLLSMDIEEHKDDSFLIVLNTIKSSVDVYGFIKKTYGEKADVYYLSANIIPRDRTDRINKIKTKPGRKIIVSTQMIEAGVDIDADRVYRDMGPMDSINQTAGRCNREWRDKKGRVILVRLADTKNHGKNYCSYVYDDILVKATQKVLENYERISERDIFSLSHKYFRELERHGDHSKGFALIDMINDLKYRDAFEFTGDRKKDELVFQLIRSEFETVDVFVEIDDEAKKAWAKYEAVMKIEDRFERKDAFAGIKKEFNQFVISVPKTAVQKHLSFKDYDFIVKLKYEMIGNAYDNDTGFMRHEVPDYTY